MGFVGRNISGFEFFHRSLESWNSEEEGPRHRASPTLLGCKTPEMRLDWQLSFQLLCHYNLEKSKSATVAGLNLILPFDWRGGGPLSRPLTVLKLATLGSLSRHWREDSHPSKTRILQTLASFNLIGLRKGQQLQCLPATHLCLVRSGIGVVFFP